MARGGNPGAPGRRRVRRDCNGGQPVGRGPHRRTYPKKALAEPLAINGRFFALKASIGIAFYPEDGRSAEELLKHADIAMYRAKASGGGYRFYRSEMGTDLARKLEIVHRLETALAAGRLQLHYHPQVHLPSGKIVGAEALSRWHDADWGMVSPAEFIPIAEERGLIGTLGEWALAGACRQVRHWQERGCPLPGRVAVNVAAKQFEDDDFVDRCLRIARESGAASSAIELELTESGMMRDPERAVEVTRALTSAGFALSIDDFGTGYSSLAYLKRFPVHKLKIDISFVRDMLTDRNDLAIVSAIVAMAKSLGLKTLAEGVEEAAQAEHLLALGCDEAQGYYFARPEPAEVFARRWLQSACPSHDLGQDVDRQEQGHLGT
nr:GGDEF domain-containing phosphodiesterase [Ralstonia mannitolilytica]